MLYLTIQQLFRDNIARVPNTVLSERLVVLKFVYFILRTLL
jgi:hypothetical protein